jgi:hypothetical protein
MTYKSKPRTIEAEQFSEFSSAPLKGVCGYGNSCPTGYLGGLHVHTIHNNQVVLIEDKDYVVPEPDGIHYYPVKPEIFEKNYEPV